MKRLIIALGIFALLGGYFWFFEVHKGREKAEKEETEKSIIPGLKKGDVTGIEIKRGGEVYSFSKTGDDWIIEKPVRDAADAAAIDGVLAAYIPGKAEMRMDAENPADFGLAQPALECTFRAASGQGYTVLVGDENPASSGVYASLRGAEKYVYLAPEPLKSSADRQIFDFRLKKALRVNRDAVTKVSVALKDKKYTLELSGKTWRVTEPVKKNAKKSRVESIINAVEAAQAKSFTEPTAANRVRYRLAGASESVTLTENGAEKTLRFGKKDGGSSSVFASSTTANDILELPDHVYNNIPALEDLFNRQVIVFEQDDAEKLTAKYGGVEFAAEKKAGKQGGPPEWKVTKASGISGEDRKKISPASVVSSLYWQDYGTKAGESLPQQMEAEDYGITQGSPVITVYLAGGAPAGSMLVGKKAPDGSYYVKSPEKNEVYTVSESFLKGLNMPGLLPEEK